MEGRRQGSTFPWHVTPLAESRSIMKIQYLSEIKATQPRRWNLTKRSRDNESFYFITFMFFQQIINSSDRESTFRCFMGLKIVRRYCIVGGGVVVNVKRHYANNKQGTAESPKAFHKKVFFLFASALLVGTTTLSMTIHFIKFILCSCEINNGLRGAPADGIISAFLHWILFVNHD